MKDLLTEKTLLWVAVFALAVSSYFLHTNTDSSCECGDRSARRGRMTQMRENMGSRSDGWEGKKLKMQKRGDRVKKQKPQL